MIAHEDDVKIKYDYLVTSYCKNEQDIWDYLLDHIKSNDQLCEYDAQIGMLSMRAALKGCEVIANF